MLSYDMLYIAGRWVFPHGDGVIAVENPAAEAVIGSVPQGSAVDVDRAALAARDAFLDWARTPWPRRQELLRSIAAALRESGEKTARTITSELGMPFDACLAVQALEPASILEAYADEMDGIAWEHDIGWSRIVMEPVGVVGAITPWNYPLYQIACKVGGALAAGCTVVLKPSELTPLNAYALIEAAEKAGLPPGVLNLITGHGSEAGEALVRHPGIDAISFTGSTVTGRRVAELASVTLKRVSMELGGKSASIVLEGADLDRAVAGTIRSCFRNSGQSCSSHTRFLIPRRLEGRIMSIISGRAGEVQLGDPAAHGNHLGPLVSGIQRERVTRYIREALASGATLVVGGADPPTGFERGYYVQPTVIVSLDPNAQIAQEEVFGPVLCVIPYDDVADAVRIANGTPYGLSAGVWSATPEEGFEVARLLRAGEVQLNGAPFNIRSPFGGFGLSGYGRELGRYGIEEFLAPKAIHQSFADLSHADSPVIA